MYTFLGTWAQQFSKDATQEGTFFGLDGTEHKTLMMNLKNKFWFTKLFDFNAVALRIPFQWYVISAFNLYI